VLLVQKEKRRSRTSATFKNLQEYDQLVVDCTLKSFCVFGSSEEEGNVPLKGFKNPQEAFLWLFPAIIHAEMSSKELEVEIIERISKIAETAGFVAICNSTGGGHFNFVLKKRRYKAPGPKREIIIVESGEIERDLFVLGTVSRLSRLQPSVILFAGANQAEVVDRKISPRLVIRADTCSLGEEALIPKKQKVFRESDEHSEKVKIILKKFKNKHDKQF
jgi:hypothetical protein